MVVAGPSLMGKDWLLKIHLDWNELYFTRNDISYSLQALMKKYDAVFLNELGTMM